MQKHLSKTSGHKRKHKTKLYVIELDEKDRIFEMMLKEDEICWEGFRKVHGKLLRGVPKRNRKDCFGFCRHEGCELL